MKKAVITALLGAALSTVSVSATADKVRLKMGSVVPSKLVQLGSLGKTLEANINAISGGDIQIKFYEPGALVPALELFDAVKSGSVDAAWSTPSYWQGKEPALALFSAVPFGAETCDAHFFPFELIQRGDFLAEPSRSFGCDNAADKGVDAVLVVNLLHQPLAATE